MNNEYQLPPPWEIPESELWKPTFEDEQQTSSTEQHPTNEQQPTNEQHHTGSVTSDENCELLVIGTLLNRKAEWTENADILSDELFSNLRYRQTFKAARACFNRGDDIDIISVNEEVLQHPKSYEGLLYSDILFISKNVIVGEQLRPKVMRLQRLSIRRKGVNILKRGVRAFLDESIPPEQIQDEVMSGMRDLYKSQSSSIKSMKEVGEAFKVNVLDANRNGTRQAFIPTGFKILDDVGALQFNNLWVIGADSGNGKTTFAEALAFHAAKNGFPTAIYSLEMSNEQLYARYMATDIGVPGNIISIKALTDEQYNRALKAIDRFNPLPIYFDERSTSSLDQILSSIRTLYYKKGIQLAIVDYIQVLPVNNARNSKTEEQNIGEMVRRCKNIAKELNICVIILSQLSKGDNTKKPTVERLRGSGQIKEGSDGVILLWRPELYNSHYPKPYDEVSTYGTAYVELGKGRAVGQPSCIVGFNPMLTKFYDIEQSKLPKRSDEPQPLKDSDGEDDPW